MRSSCKNISMRTLQLTRSPGNLLPRRVCELLAGVACQQLLLTLSNERKYAMLLESWQHCCFAKNEEASADDSRAAHNSLYKCARYFFSI